MPSDLSFEFRDNNCQVFITEDGKELFHGADVCRMLGRADNSARTIKTFVKPKWWIDYPNPNGGKPVLCLFEPGVYQLATNPIFPSDFASDFQDLIFEKVLPKLRAEGGYLLSSATNEQVEALVTAHKKQIAALEKENLAIAKEHDGMLTAIKRDGQLVVYQEVDQYDEDLGDWVKTRRKVPAKATKATRTGTVLFHSIDEAASAGRNKVVLVKMQTERKLGGVKLYPDETGKKCLMKMRPIETVDKHDLFGHLSRKRKVHIVDGVEIPEGAECDINFSPDRGYVGCPTEQYWIIAKKGDYDYDA